MSDSGKQAQIQERQQEFERGEAIEVPVGRIEAELAALWRRAAESHDHKPRPVTRACLWNLVVRSADEHHFRYIKGVIDDLAQRLPTRTIVTRPEPNSSDGLRAWVEANWRRQGGVAASGSDEITLWAGGKAVERLSSLVRALLYVDAPTALFWQGPLPPRLAPHVREMIHEAERLIVDTRRLTEETGLRQLINIVEADPELEVSDLSWIGISPLLGMLASLFDPPRNPAELAQIERARVTSNIQGTQARGLLALGWLMSRLGWTAPKRQAEAHATRRWQAKRPDGKMVTLELTTTPGAATHGVAGLELFGAGGRHWSLLRDESIHVKAPDLPPRSQPARSHPDAELLAAALGARGRDPTYKQALTSAAALVEATS